MKDKEKMSTVGKLKRTENNGYVNISGTIRTLQMGLQISLESVSFDTSSESAPTHKVKAKAGDQYIEVGAAWMRQLTNGEHAGQDFYSITIDDPSLPAPLTVAAFPTGAPGEFEIVWRRKRGGGNAEPGGEMPADDISY
jgi:uncharacterized protein (DUF736 family)